jgi:hypothetical protein
MLALFSASAEPSTMQSATKDEPFVGGPLDGISVGQLIRVRNGQPDVGLKPSQPNASPIPARFEAAVQGLLAAYQAHDIVGQRSFLTKSAKGELCPEGITGECGTVGPLFQDQFKEHCEHNTPYYVRDSGEVRIEWLCNGELWYISYLRVRDDKVSHVRTAVAYVPPIIKLKSR